MVIDPEEATWHTAASNQQDLEQINHELGVIETMLEVGDVGGAMAQLTRTQATLYNLLR